MEVSTKKLCRRPEPKAPKYSTHNVDNGPDSPVGIARKYILENSHVFEELLPIELQIPAKSLTPSFSGSAASPRFVYGPWRFCTISTINPLS
jgi:hypothetical protein